MERRPPARACAALTPGPGGSKPLATMSTLAQPPLVRVPAIGRAVSLPALGIVVLAVVLDWAATWHPTYVPVWLPWDFNPLQFLSLAFAGWWYARGVALTPVAERPNVWRRIAFGLGLLAIYAVLQTRYDYMAQHMFFLHRGQHIVMHHLAPFLIALSWPGATLARGMPAPFRRFFCHRAWHESLSVLQQPFIAAILFVGLIYMWLIPALHFRAMLNPFLYNLMNWSMVLDGLLFWCLVLDPRPKPPCTTGYGGRMVLSVATMFPQIALGAYITFSHHDLYPYYDLCGRIFPSISALYDQQIGGIIIWIPAGMMSATAFLLTLNHLRLEEERQDKLEWKENPPDEGAFVIDASGWTGR